MGTSDTVLHRAAHLTALQLGEDTDVLDIALSPKEQAMCEQIDKQDALRDALAVRIARLEERLNKIFYAEDEA